MRIPTLAAALVAVVTLPALAEEAPPPAPPPATPLPAFENPLHDAKVGETLRFVVRDQAGTSQSRWYEERVLARRDGDWVLVEVVETSESGDKIWSIDPSRSRWYKATADLKLGEIQRWVKEKQKDELVALGEPTPRVSVRATLRVIDEPVIYTDPEGRRRQRKVWLSHDVPCTGKVKEFPVADSDDFERKAVAWDKVLSPTECAERAKRYRDPEEPKEEPKKEEPKDGEKPKEPPAEPGMGGDAPPAPPAPPTPAPAPGGETPPGMGA